MLRNLDIPLWQAESYFDCFFYKFYFSHFRGVDAAQAGVDKGTANCALCAVTEARPPCQLLMNVLFCVLMLSRAASQNRAHRKTRLRSHAADSGLLHSIMSVTRMIHSVIEGGVGRGGKCVCVCVCVCVCGGMVVWWRHGNQTEECVRA